MKSIGNHKYLFKNGTIHSSKRRMTLRLPEELYRKLDEAHRKYKKSMNALIVEFLGKQIANEEMYRRLKI